MLSEICTRTWCPFLDKNTVLMKNGKPDFSLDQDNIHLNQQGGTIFETFIRQHIDSIIGIQRRNNQVSGERDTIVIDTDDEPTGSKSYRRQHFQHGRRRFTNISTTKQQPYPNNMNRISQPMNRNSQPMNRNYKPIMVYMPVPAWMTNKQNQYY